MKKLIAMLMVMGLIGGTAWAGGSAKTNNFRYQVQALQTFVTNAEGLSVPNYNLGINGERLPNPNVVLKKTWKGTIGACEYPASTWKAGSAYFCFDSRYPSNDYPL